MITTRYAFDALLQERDVEVDEETEFQLRQLEVSEELRFVDRPERVDALEFDDQPVVDDEIEAISAVEPHVSIGDRYWTLALERNSGQRKLVAKALLVRGLK